MRSTSIVADLRPFALLVSVAALLFTGCATVARVGVTPMLRPFRMPNLVSPSLPHEDFELRTDDGFTLRGWLFRPSGTPKGLFVYLHGLDNNRQLGAEIAERFVPEGWAVLAFDQRAHGSSDGTYCTYGFHEVRDLEAAIDQVGITPVVVAGESMGAAVALQTTAIDPRIEGVVAAASFSDLTTIVDEVGAPLTRSKAVRRDVDEDVEHLAGFHVSDISPRVAAAKIHVPALLFHGTDDLFVAPAHSRRIYDALHTDKELVTVIGAGHPDILKHSEVWDVIERWVATLPSHPAPTASR